MQVKHQEGRRVRPLRLAIVSASSVALLFAVVCVKDGGWTSDSIRGGWGQSVKEDGRLEGVGSKGVVGGESFSGAAAEFEGLPISMVEKMDFNADPCDNAYQFACGKFLKTAVIPDYKSSWSSSFDVASTRIMKEMREDLENDDGEAGLYYQSCMNTTHLDELGAGPILNLFDRLEISNVKDANTLTDFLLKFSLLDHSVMFSWWVQQDEEHNNKHMVALSGGDLSMPDRQYYIGQEENFVKHREAFVSALSSIFSILSPGSSAQETEQQAQAVLNIESKIADAVLEASEVRKLSASYAFDQGKMNELCPSVRWDMLFAGLGFNTVGAPGGARLAVYDAPYFKKLHKLLSETSFEDIRTFLRWKVTKIYSPFLPSNMVSVFVKWNRDLYGLTHISPRWKKCFKSTEAALRQHVSKMFIERHTLPEVFKEAEILLHNIRSEFASDLEHEVSWMSNHSRTLALSKLAAMGFRVGGPKVWELRAALVLKVDDFLGNGVKIGIASATRERQRLTLVPDSTRWTMASTVVNAYYNREQNSLFIPAAILQAPFFSRNVSWAANYGAIGTVLGHEMTHGFDDMGHLYDDHGRRGVQEWDNETEDAFTSRAQCIASQFSNFTVAGGFHVNGQLTLGEDIADAGGLKLSYRALLTSSGGSISPLAEKEFFLSFAQTWCSVERDEAAGAGVLQDEHSPPKWRVNGALQNFAPFAKTFQCRVGSMMNPGREAMCTLW